MNAAPLAAAAIFVGLLLARGASAASKRPDSEWMPAILTEYHPDAPPQYVKMDGGPNDRKGNPIITVQQFQRDRAAYPFVSVAGDLTLRGAPVPYGTRLYLGMYPDVVFRIVDTGGRFHGEKKRYRQPGSEPFDIATEWGSKLGFSMRQTVYRIDRSDTLDPKARKQRNA